MNATINTVSAKAVRKLKTDAEVYKKRLLHMIIATCVLLAAVVASVYSLVNTTVELSDTTEYALKLESDNFVKEMEIQGLNDTIDGLNAEIDSLSTSVENYQKSNKQFAGSIANLKSIIDELDLSNQQLIKENKKLNKKVKALQKKISVYDKYAYAVFDKGGNRTDLTYEQIKTGEELMLEKGMDPDLLFGIIMTESTGKENASNSTSTARGYGQVLAGTAKTVYEDIQGHGKGTYSHSMAFNGMTNISLVVSYLDWMHDNGWSLNKTIIRYRGLNDPAYFRSIDSYISKSGNSLAKISASW